MMRRVDGAMTTILGVVLALAAVTWVMVTQTRSNPGATLTPTSPRSGTLIPMATETTTGTPPTPQPEATSSLNYFLAVFQPFEHGFLLQRVGEACVYAYVTDAQTEGIILSPVVDDDPSGRYAYCIPFEGLNDRTLNEPANTLLQENTPFRFVWGTYRQVRAGLGDPTGEQVNFESPFVPTPQPPENGVATTPIVYLPDGRLFTCSKSDGVEECSTSE